jgi:uncharacterized membrane protein (DUF2068 family)
MKIPDTKNIDRGIKTVAVFEALKGIIALIAGIILLRLVHDDLQLTAEKIVRHLHLNPIRYFPHLFLLGVSKITASKLHGYAAFAFFYSFVRFVEAFGLWRLKAWAEWFAILSGAIYIPFEIFGLFRHATFLKGGIFIFNLLIVLYLLYVRIVIRKSAKQIA